VNKLLSSPSAAGRWADGVIVCLVGVACLFVFYLIKFDLCGNDKCGDLVYTKFWANSAELFILYGLAIFLVGIFLIREKVIIRLYRLGIVVVVITGFILSGIIVFGIGSELGSAT